MTVKSWTEISEERLRSNYEVLQRAAGTETPVLAVVKANAYGHGIRRVLRCWRVRGLSGWGLRMSAKGLQCVRR